MRDNRFLKRLRKKAKKGLRGWPLATIAFYGPNLSQATKAAVGIIPSENAQAEEIRAWHVLHGDIREDVSVSQEIVEFIQDHGALSVVMTDSIIGCPHQEGIDYQGEWCPVCEFWRGAIALRDRCLGNQGRPRWRSITGIRPRDRLAVAPRSTAGARQRARTPAPARQSRRRLRSDRTRCPAAKGRR
jgi:hypothetical protein